MIASWLIILKLRNLMCGLPYVSLIDCLITTPEATILVFGACRCGTVSAVPSIGMPLITCGAALCVFVLAWRGGAILGCVIFECTWCVVQSHALVSARICVHDPLRGRIVGQHGWWCITQPLNCWTFFSAHVIKHPLSFIFHPLFWRRGGEGFLRYMLPGALQEVLGL